MKILRFEEIEAWKKGRELTRSIYLKTRSKEFSSDRDLCNQIHRACVSITSNIAEGFESQSNPEFVRFLTYSRRSASEVKNQLYIALDERYITEDEFKQLYDSASEISKMLLGFIRYLRVRNRRSNRV